MGTKHRRKYNDSILGTRSPRLSHDTFEYLSQTLATSLFFKEPSSGYSAWRHSNLMCAQRSILNQEWWSLSGSNRRPPACKAGALPAELRPQVVGLGGLEPPASPLSGVRSNHLSYRPNVLSQLSGGACRDRTDDPLLAKQVLSQLS